MPSSIPTPLGVSRKSAKAYASKVQAVLSLREQYASLDEETIKAKAVGVRAELQTAVSKKRRSELQVEVFALASIAATRTLGQTPYAVQILGGLVLADGAISEMATGEGKTLTAVAPVAWWALHGKGAHVATANEYLAERDALELAPAYEALGLTVAYTHRDHDLQVRKDAYLSDITYATAQTLGFDYLTDNLAHNPEDTVRRPAFAAIVDEADSLLIDEARTPLIISAPDPRLIINWSKYTDFVSSLTAVEDYEVDKSEDIAILTEAGADKAEKHFGVQKLYDNPVLVQRLLTCVRAEGLLVKDQDYIVTPTEVIIVDANTGRAMDGRRFQDGIHEALEAKEGIPSKAPSVTMASVTLQAFFGMYEHLGGMTGTALTDAEELSSTYGTNVVGIPTHRPRARKDMSDYLFPDAESKFKSLAEEIKKRQASGQPVLVGTSSVEESERISSKLEALGVQHQVLNARSSEKESRIIAQAGRLGAVTISTNMAGRGVDIKLGGEPTPDVPEVLRIEEKTKVLNLGGLVVFATSRAASRRVDNQLRGRSGRQGEPGETRFFLAADDELITTFGGPQVGSLVKSMATSSEGPISHPALSKMLERSQRKVEDFHAESRKSLVEFDGVHTAQRRAFYALRDSVLRMPFEVFLESFIPSAYQTLLKSYERDVNLKKISDDELAKKLGPVFPTALPQLPVRTAEAIASELAKVTTAHLEGSFSALGDDEELKTTVARRILMDMIDQFWTGHLAQMENLQGSVALRRYAQVDPKIAFAQEAKLLYAGFLERFYRSALGNFWKLRMTKQASTPAEVTDEHANQSGAVEEPTSTVPEAASVIEDIPVEPSKE